MLSKLDIDKSSINCCKCDCYFDTNNNPIELPCFHLVCSQCVSSFKLKFFFHCVNLKVFTTFQSSSNDYYVINLVRKLKLFDSDERNGNLEMNIDLFYNDYTIRKKINFDLIKKFINCPNCNRLFNFGSRLPITLPCCHSICSECLYSSNNSDMLSNSGNNIGNLLNGTLANYANNNSSNSSTVNNIIKCNSCMRKYHKTNAIFQADEQSLEIMDIFKQLIMINQQNMIDSMECFMTNFDNRLDLLKKNIDESSHRLVKQILKQSSTQKKVEIETNLNTYRSNLLDQCKNLSTNRLDLINNLINLSNNKKNHHKYETIILNKLEELRKIIIQDKYSYFDYKKNDLECKYSLIQLIGSINNTSSIKKRIKYLNLNSRFININCQNEKITQPEIKVTGFQWIRQSPKADYLVPINLDKIFYIYLNDTDKKINNYTMKLTNKFSQQQDEKHIEREVKIPRDIKNMKLDYCRANHEKILLYFEIKYEMDYLVEIYDTNNLRLISSIRTNYFVENFILSDFNEIVSWSSNIKPYIKFYDHKLKDIVHLNNLPFHSSIFDKYYFLADQTQSILVFHNQHHVGIVCKKTGNILNEISLHELNNFGQDNTVLVRDQNNEYHQQARARGHLSQSKSEYINLKCFQSKYLILTTWSSIYLFDLMNGLKLLISNNLYSIPHNNWSIPNKLYVSSKYGDVSFFDPSTSFLTYI